MNPVSGARERTGSNGSGRSDVPSNPIRQVAANFEQIASSIEAAQSPAAMCALLEQTMAWCRQPAGRVGQAEMLLSNLATALQAWRQVWPRMGTDREFRLAVAREARRWSTQLQAFAAHT